MSHPFNRRDFLRLAAAVPFVPHAFPSSAFNKAAPSPEDLFDPWLEINASHVAWNVAQVRKRVQERPIMAVVKCNGYGHGLVGMAQILQKNGIRHFAVVKVEEALELRKNGIQGMILNFGSFTAGNAVDLVQNDISQSVFSEAVDYLAAAARKLGRRAKVHIKIDTGLGRVGVPYYEALSYIERVAAMPDIQIEGIFTTFTEEPDFDPVQLRRFLDVCEQAKKKGINVGYRHAASTDAVAKFPDAFLDMVRPGNCLYGLEKWPNLDLRQSLSLKTRVLYIKKMYPGETIAYHRRYKVERESLIATIPLGYSDGYPWRAVNKAYALIRGKKWPVIAYMSANHVMLDITGAKDIRIGDEVVLFGQQGDEFISLTEIAELGDSSVYKVAIGMNPLLPRVYV
jgi:alanine racemase